MSKRKLYLLHSCLKSLEGVHLSASSHLLNLLIEKFFHLPYLSLVRYADHIACQRVEMMQSLSPDELLNQLTEQHVKILNNFFSQRAKYSKRHQRLISLLDHLKRQVNDYNAGIIPDNVNTADKELDASLELCKTPSTPITNSSSLFFNNMKTSPSIDFFMLYVSDSASNSKTTSTISNLDKEW